MLNFKKKLWIIKQKQIGKLTDPEIAVSQKITHGHVQRIWTGYKKDGLDFLREKPLGRKPTEIQEHMFNKFFILLDLLYRYI